MRNSKKIKKRIKMKKLTLFLILGSFLISLKCNDNNSNKKEEKERITWIIKYIKQSELLKDNSKSLIETASFFYQKEILTGVAEPENYYNKKDKAILLDFIKNTSKRLKIEKINQSLSIVNTFDFESDGAITKVDHLWIKNNDDWSLFNPEEENLPYPGQKISVEELKGKKGKYVILRGGCCDTESLAIFEISKDQPLKHIYSGTLYGSSYRLIRKNGKLEIFETDMEGNLSEISLEPK
jgi:hypothetical protein